jgi:hypothetical protein
MSANKRYIVKYFNERSEIEQSSMGRDCWHLVDTLTDESVWSDHMEPEDAILVRDLDSLVIMLNEAEEEKTLLEHAASAEADQCDLFKAERDVARNAARVLRDALLAAGASSPMVDGLLLAPLFDKENELPAWIKVD